MESIVGRLIKVEEDAKKIVEEAMKEEIVLNKRLEQEKVNIEAAIMRDVQKEIDATKQSEEKRLYEIREQIEAVSKSKLADMEEQFIKNNENWCNEIFNTIVGK